MKRFITYLFEYDNGNKRKNIGFIRTDIRNGTCQMEVHVHNLNRFQGKGQIFLLADQGELIGIPVGSMVISQGRGDGKCVFPANPVAGTEYPFTAIVGVGIQFGNQYYAASSWLDGNREEFGTGKFRVWEESVQPVGRKPEREEEPKLPETPAQRSSETPTLQPEPREISNRKRQPSEVPQPETPQQMPGLQQPPREPLPTPETSTPQQEPTLEMPKQTPEGMQQISEIPQMQTQERAILSDTEETRQPVIRTTRMDINGIHQLPKKNWYLCNNSFVIHGYFNYHYLILREVQENGTSKHYLGVPGIYERPERMMAMLFGFPGFEPEEDPKKGNRQAPDEDKEPEEGVFGYWLCLLDM